MALSPQQRQRKLERKQAKQKAKRNAMSRWRVGGLAAQLKRVSVAPVLHCCTNGDMWDQGIGHVLLSRELHDGKVAFGVFLVDLFCLGVKDAWGAIGSREQYDDRLHKGLAERCHLTELEPAAARKLVEGAVAYAESLGIDPHADYQKVRPIFGNIDPAQCAEEFEFGRKGKPFFVSGPYDTPEKCRRIITTLERACAPGGYDYLMMVGPSGGEYDFDMDDDNLDEDEEDFDS